MTIKPTTMNKQSKPEGKKCKHEWVEDEMFASGVVMFVGGSPSDMGEETMVVCKKCGEYEYIRTKDLGSIIDIYESTL